MPPLAIRNGEMIPLAEATEERVRSAEKDQKMARILAYGVDMGIPTQVELNAWSAMYEEALDENERRSLGAMSISAAA